MHVRDFNYGDFGADILLPVGAPGDTYLDWTGPVEAPQEYVAPAPTAEVLRNPSPLMPAPAPRVSRADVIRAGSTAVYTAAPPKQESSGTAVLVVLGIGALLLMRK